MGSSIKKRIGPYQKLFYRTKALTSLIGDKFMSKTLVLINCIKNYPKLKMCFLMLIIYANQVDPKKHKNVIIFICNIILRGNSFVGKS